MLSKLLKILSCSFVVLLLCFAVSAFALAAALAGEYIFGLLPCELCLWQRVPFMVVAVLSLGGIVWSKISYPNTMHPDGNQDLSSRQIDADFSPRSRSGVAGRRDARKRTLRVIIAANAFAFFINAVIAFYHSGVEADWWESFLQGCAVPDLDPSKSILDQIQALPSVPCDQPAWVDPLLGLSMANWNVPFCFLMAGVCFFSLRKN